MLNVHVTMNTMFPHPPKARLGPDRINWEHMVSNLTRCLLLKILEISFVLYSRETHTPILSPGLENSDEE